MSLARRGMLLGGFSSERVKIDGTHINFLYFGVLAADVVRRSRTLTRVLRLPVRCR